MFVHYDEFETGNALGSHAGVNKFGAVYTYIACLPPDIASKLSSISFTALVCAKDKNLCTNEEVFKFLIDELNFLRSHGIEINIENTNYRIYFQLALLLGDNIGMNEYLDMVESFKSTPFCRICRASADKWKYMTREDKSILRNRTNYEADCRSNNPQETGIKRESTFNSVRNFHIMENVSFDIMHDFLHGVGCYVIRYIIHEFVFVKKTFYFERVKCSHT